METAKHDLHMASEHGAKRMKVDIAQKDVLDAKQRDILNLCLAGKNIFLTGVGGVMSCCKLCITMH